MKTNIPKLDTSKIVQVRLAETQYYQQEYPKKHIVLHHTVSSGNAKTVMEWWAKTIVKVGTAFIIDREGVIYQCFSSKHWAHHLGTRRKNNKQLNQESIGIELCSWGGLIKKTGANVNEKPKFFTKAGKEIPAEEVFDLGKKFRGYQYFQKYTEKQLKSLQILVNYLCETYNIPKTYNDDMWEVSDNALNGKGGIYTHVSFRKDKSDCFPQTDLTRIIMDLKNFQ